MGQMDGGRSLSRPWDVERPAGGKGVLGTPCGEYAGSIWGVTFYQPVNFKNHPKAQNQSFNYEPLPAVLCMPRVKWIITNFSKSADCYLPMC